MSNDLLEFDDPLLKQTAKHVTAFDDDNKELQTLIDDLIRTLNETGGVGIAAPQIGVSQRVFVINFPGSEYSQVFINPEIIDRGDSFHSLREGCLSFIPGVEQAVPRHDDIRIKAQNILGESFEMNLETIAASIFQHELDHLNGILFIDRLSRIKRNKILEHKAIGSDLKARLRAYYINNPTIDLHGVAR